MGVLAWVVDEGDRLLGRARAVIFEDNSMVWPETRLGRGFGAC